MFIYFYLFILHLHPSLPFSLSLSFFFSVLERSHLHKHAIDGFFIVAKEPRDIRKRGPKFFQIQRSSAVPISTVERQL